MKKNDILEIKIEDMGNTGEGIGKLDGYTLFVKDAIIGDVVKVKVMKTGKSYGFAKLLEIISPSEKRVTPMCSISRACGGCQLQAMSYEEQLKYKENKVRNNLERIGKLSNFKMNPIVGMEHPQHYRNKAQFPVGTDKYGNIIVGFYAGRTHSIIESESCMLGWEINEEIIKCVKSFMKRNKIAPYDEKTGNGLIRHILIRVAAATNEVMVCLIINGMKIPNSQELVRELKKISGVSSISLNVNMARNNVILGKEIINLYGKGYITDYIGDVQFRISPLSFYQVNPVQTKKLYETALKYANLTGSETVWDLYCGIGTISLFLARNAGKVYGVEIVPEAINDAKINAQINNINNVEFFVGKAEEVVLDFYDDKKSPDVIVVDPPRKGCDKTLLETIIKVLPKRLVYVSCDSATLARDLHYLCNNGYELIEVQPVDMFGHTVHVETVVLLSQRKADDYVEVELELDELDVTSAERR
ncbi:MAG: 23S rRNA (uracil(1939)-C(5))-methyltransferase RlmD [Eubacterium sp.]